MAALTVYLTTQDDELLTNARKLVSAAPSSETYVLSTLQMPQTSTGWVELHSRAEAASSGSYSGSEPAPSGHGFLFDVTDLEAMKISAGTWTPAIKLATNGASNTVTLVLHVRAFVRHNDGSYTQIGSDINSNSITLSATTASALTFAGTSLPEVTLEEGDKLYIDLIAQVTTGFSSSTASRRAFRLYENGGAADRVVTPGYVNAYAPKQTQAAEVGLADSDAPADRVAHTINIRGRLQAGSGVFKAVLREGLTDRSGELTGSALTHALANYTLAVPDAVAEAITDYTNLSIKWWVYSALGNGAGAEVARVWLDKPVGAPEPPAVDPSTKFFAVL